MAKIFAFGFVCDFNDFLCEFSVKTTELTVAIASNESSKFHRKFFNCIKKNSSLISFFIPWQFLDIYISG
jgi:hypothetical protein